MTGPLRFTLRIVIVIVLLAIVGMGASAPIHKSAASPYLSPLAKLVVRNANASQCPIQKCKGRGPNHFICVHNNAFTECLITSPTTCNTQSCVVN
ncbi:MAG: hypothetical protein E6K78_05140 [Candidatus Eisenbacteria bacterium]|uniref:Uncharacterized protein n=1 Tax=Eiseniibacteriota bacterium TaxID=2212470 RepID=A0A538TUL4_UNCEI|nr:MAG: hypothetical protein E6K78_05140 [Candidatus Eisenbacteria bacterium]